MENGEWRGQVTHDQVDGGDCPGPDGSGQQVGPKSHRPHRDEHLPEFDQQGVESVARWVGDAEDRRNELVLGWVAKERGRSSSRAVEGKGGEEDQERNEAPDGPEPGTWSLIPDP